MKKSFLLILSAVLMISFSSPAGAGSISGAETLIQNAMAESLTIINNQQATLPQKRAQLWQVVLGSFDFKLIAEFTLGKFSSTSKKALGDYSDRRFSSTQQKEFTELFKNHLGNIYLDRLNDDHMNPKIDITQSLPLKPRKGMQRARINTILNEKTPIDYMLRLLDNQWRIYDVKVEGRSLVASFRKEYNALLLKQTPAELIEILREKNREHDKDRESKH